MNLALRRGHERAIHRHRKAFVRDQLGTLGFLVFTEYRLCDIVAFHLTRAWTLCVEVECSLGNARQNARRNLKNGATAHIALVPGLQDVTTLEERFRADPMLPLPRIRIWTFDQFCPARAVHWLEFLDSRGLTRPSAPPVKN